MRLFVAMDIPDEVRARVADFTRQLRPHCPGARWTRLEGIHVTLKFIGETPEANLPRIREALGAVRSDAPVELRFRGTGFFPNARQPRVFWAGIEASQNLAAVAADIESRLDPLGIPRETRAFHPHLTLARFQPGDKLTRLREELEKLGAADFGGTRSGEFYLYHSVLKRGGAEYTKLATFSFVEPR